MSTGVFTVWPADSNGAPINPPVAGGPATAPDPGLPAAENIYFGINTAAQKSPSNTEVELQTEISKVLSVIQRLYLNASARTAGANKFRIYYARLFRLAQIGLEGPQGGEEIAKAALAMVAADVIDDEAGRIKNGHMKVLGAWVIAFCAPFLILYVLLKLSPSTSLQTLLTHLEVTVSTLANFMLLWVGCFIGVWLSYGVRTTALSISDLVVTDSDRLIPAIRLIFAGLLTMLLGVTFVLGLVEIKIGTFPITDIATRSMLAFLVGVFCGLSELALPASVAKRASDFIGKLK